MTLFDLELMGTTTDVIGVWQDLAREHGLKIEDVSGDVVKAVNDASKRVGRYRMRSLTWEELEKLGVGLFGRATYEAWSGNAIAPTEPFTLAKFEQALRLMMGERCPMRDCEIFDLAQREVPEHVSEEVFDLVGRGVEDHLSLLENQRAGIREAFAIPNRRGATGHSPEEILEYVTRAVGEPQLQNATATQVARWHADMVQRVQRLAEQYREPDGRPDRVSIAAEIAAWMHHPRMEVFAENAARHRDAMRRRWDERMRRETAPHPDLVFRR